MEKILDVRIIEPRLKHPTIFNTFDETPLGEGFVILNDHDPKPLYYQLMAERPNTFVWEYIKNGPIEWQVKIHKLNPETNEPSIGAIAAEDYRKALVFKKFGLDFCCGGKQTLDIAAKAKGIDKELILKELNLIDNKVYDSFQDYTKWETSELVDHIINRHHSYVKEISPDIVTILTKVVNVHSNTHPELKELHQKFLLLHEDLNNHMYKEENVLFPYIKMLALPENANIIENAVIHSAINAMESEHELAGEYLEDIKKLTNNYTIPEDACGSYRMLYGLLNEYDEDLKLHIHLENNILFPKAIKLEAQHIKK